MKKSCLIILMAAVLFSGCKAKENFDGTAENEILTFINNEEDKTVIRIGTQHYTPDTGLTDALNKQFPDYLFVIDYSAAMGRDSMNRMSGLLDRENSYDMIITGDSDDFMDFYKEKLLDLSAEPFLDDYLLSSLNRVSTEGHIYAIPGPSIFSGIAYNTEMFEKYDWEIPADTETFFSLCESIRAEGIEPFSTCFKYDGQVNRLLGMMCYSELYKSPEDMAWKEAVQEGKATYQGHMEPFFELAKRFYDTGVITPDTFSASLTKQRQAFWDGQYAMIDYDSGIFSYSEAENAPFKIGMMPYPAQKAEDACYAINPVYCLAIPKRLENEPEKLLLMKKVFTFLSTQEGQEAMQEESIRSSNVIGVDLTQEMPSQNMIAQASERGNLYPLPKYEHCKVSIFPLQQAAVQTIFEGGSVDAAISMIDQSIREELTKDVPEAEYEVLTTATEDFSMLETSYLIADILKQLTGADIGIMLNGGFFRSNLAMLNQGEVTSDVSLFVMKGMGTEDYLTTYSMTGKQIKNLLEHPIINGEEIDSYIAASGLKVEYAPWNERGTRVLKVSMEDGSELKDDQVYTVAAYQGAIAENYITEVQQTYEQSGPVEEVMKQALGQYETVSPDIQNRVKLVWPKKER